MDDKYRISSRALYRLFVSVLCALLLFTSVNNISTGAAHAGAVRRTSRAARAAVAAARGWEHRPAILPELNIWPAATALFIDDFNDDTRDPYVWGLGVLTKKQADPRVEVAERNQRLEIMPQPGIVGFNGYVCVPAFDFTNKGIVVELVQGSSGAGGETLFSVGNDVFDHYQMSVSDGTLYFISSEAGSQTYTQMPYDPWQDRYLRLRHDQGADEIVWETSANDAAWVERRRKARGIALGAVRVELAAGTWQPTFAPGPAFFDNFRLETGSVDTTPPAVSFTSPRSGETVSGRVTIAATATDDVGVSRVEFYANGYLINTITTGPYRFEAETMGVPDGVYTLQARAYDAAGNHGTDTIFVTLNNQTPPSGSTINLNPSVIYQTMSGWEATAQAGQEDSAAFPLYRDALYDQAANDLGLNRLRLEVRAGDENPQDYWSQYRIGLITEDQWNRLRHEIVNDNSDPFSINPNGFQFADLDYAVETVVLPLKQRLEARGENLFVNLCYVDFGPSPFEHKNDPEEYAEFVLATYQRLQSRYGLVPDVWEVILEPDTTAASWSGAQVGRAIVAAANRLRAAGFTPSFVAPSTTNAANAPIYFDQINAVSGATQHVSEISYHRYCCATPEVLQQISTRAVQFGKRTAMLELIGADYHVLHEDIKLGRASSWQQYTLAYPTTDDGAQFY